MNKKSESVKQPINTEKIYLFRRICEEACLEQHSGFQSWNIFKRKIFWPELQAALKLVEMYEEVSIEDLKKQLNERSGPTIHKLRDFGKSKYWAHYKPEGASSGFTEIFNKKTIQKSK